MNNMEARLAAARGEIPCDLVITNAKIVNVFNAEILPGTVGIHDGIIVGIGEYEGTERIDAGGAFMVPGFVEGHIHVESTMLTIPEFARTVLPHGTTTAVIDPHEIANVFGLEGIRYMLDSAENCPLDIFVMLPSCVPASPFESAGAELNADDLATLIDHPRVAGIGEVMNYPAVCNGDPEFMRRIALAGRKTVDGHSPMLRGALLNAYLTAGIQTDHECIKAEEALEKLRGGMHIHIREGSTEHNLAELVRIVTPENARFISLVSDDRHPDDLVEKGHLNYSVRLAIKHGIPPITAIRMVTINTARCYHLDHIGAIAPGYQADFFLTDTLQNCIPVRVFKRGITVAERGACIVDTGSVPPLPGKSMRVAPVTGESFRIAVKGPLVRIIQVEEHQIVTRQVIEPVPQKDGFIHSDPQRDIIKIAVVERHHATGRIGTGLVRGLGLKKGAIGSTVAHDAHNIIVTGLNDEDMAVAVQALIDSEGGLVVVCNGSVIASLALPIAGLMSDRKVEDVIERQQRLQSAVRELGCSVSNPFMTLSFLALTPIPELKITDRGLFDAVQFKPVELFLDSTNALHTITI